MKNGRLISVLTALLLVMSTSAQILFDGKKAAVDNLTGTWLISVPRAVFGTDYTTSITVDETITQCLIDSIEVTDSVTFSNVKPVTAPQPSMSTSSSPTGR